MPDRVMTSLGDNGVEAYPMKVSQGREPGTGIEKAMKPEVTVVECSPGDVVIIKSDQTQTHLVTPGSTLVITGNEA